MDDFTALKSKIKNIALLPAEKAAILERVAGFVEARPFTASHLGLGYFLGWRFTVPAFLVLFLAVSAVTTWAAEGALPGDVLYPIKIKINEEVRGLLTLNPKTKVELEGRLAAERLEEAGKLAARGELTPESTKEIETRLTEHVARVKERVVKLGAVGRAQEAVEAVVKIDNLIQSEKTALSAVRPASSPLAAQDVAVAALVNQAENIKLDLEKTAVQTLTRPQLK